MSWTRIEYGPYEEPEDKSDNPVDCVDCGRTMDLDDDVVAYMPDDADENEPLCSCCKERRDLVAEEVALEAAYQMENPEAA